VSDPVWEELDRFKHADGGFAGDWPPAVKRFWSPDDDVHGALKHVIGSARKTLSCAMYGWDDDELDALFRTAWESEHVAVQLCLDSSQAGGVHERELLAKWQGGSGNLPFVIGRSRKHAISHLKLCIVDGLYVVQGSTNWSTSGETAQNNECTILRDRTMAHDSTWKVALTYAEMSAQAAKA
jgi:phosphatidylserine/phosphatidylglycerophosphate/cardiolipin synthase-like enzyme